MDNLIDRKVLLREMEELYNKRAVDVYMTGDKEIRVSWNDAVYLVTIAPTIEVEPTKHGHWIRLNGDSRFMCSVCKWKENVPTCNGEPTIWDYCPSCGARMDGGEND